MGAEETENAAAWRAWFVQLANLSIIKDIGLNHALIDHRSVQAQDTYRRVGDLLFHLVKTAQIDAPPPSVALTAGAAHEYKRYLAAKRKTTSKADALIGKALSDDGTLDMEQLVTDYMTTSQKKTTYTSIFYHLGQLNPEWAREWRNRLPMQM